MALTSFPSIWFLPLVAVSVWSGRAAFNLLPLLEGVDLEEGVWGLEPVS